MLAKKLVILANSIKHRNHCVAGKCLTTGAWIRPVSTINGDALNNDQIRCRNPYGFYMVKTLQKVTIQFDSAVPLLNQPENYLIAANSEWKQDYKISPPDLVGLLDAPLSIWGDGCKVSYDAIVQNRCKPEQSLFLVQTDNLELYYTAEKKRRVLFTYNGKRYDLPATDPQFDSLVREQRDTMGILCISLGEQLNGYFYKIVAAIY
jgi:hypothetical protein